MTPRVDKYRLLQLVDSKLTAISKMATIVVAFLLVLVMPACSNEDGVVKDDNTVVTLSITTVDNSDTKTKGAGTRADADDPSVSGNKDYYVGDLTVYIFDSNGDVIGSVYGGPNINSQITYSGKTINVSIKTRKATGCTVYAVANAGTQASPNRFAGISKKADFDKQYQQLTATNDIDKATSLIMFGELRDFDTEKSGTIPLKRLASKFDFTIKVGTEADVTEKWPIIIDSYQLCHVPMASYYVLPFWNSVDKMYNGLGNRDVPTVTPQYGDYDAVTVSASSVTPFAYYTYGNNITDMKTSATEPAPANATYLEIKAHAQVSTTDTRKVWESTYKVYLGGDGATGATPGTPVASGGTYNGNFLLAPNIHYAVTININGSGHSENGGMRVTYQAKPYFTGSLDNWGSDTDRDLDVKARTK